MRTNVTNTSVAAYRELEASGKDANQRERIARVIIARTIAGHRSWMAQMSRDLGMGDNRVSRALNELAKAGEITLDGTRYVVDVQSPVFDKATRRWSLVDPVTGQRAKSYAIRLPVSRGEQTSLFE